MATDPICGMSVDAETASACTEHADRVYYFCSDSCRQAFEADPEEYLPHETTGVATQLRSALERVVIPVTGMTCPDCAEKIEKALLARPGAVHAAANLNTGVAGVDYDASSARVADFLEAIREAGFTRATARVRLSVKGMTCASCVTAVEQTLAQADVGLAIGTGTDVTIEASDITLIKGSLNGVMTAMEISRATVRNVYQNLFGEFIYNTLGIPVAMGVLYPFFAMLLSPLIAAAAMASSSVTVVINANRLRYYRAKGVPT